MITQLETIRSTLASSTGMVSAMFLAEFSVRLWVAEICGNDGGGGTSSMVSVISMPMTRPAGLYRGAPLRTAMPLPDPMSNTVPPDCTVSSPAGVRTVGNV